MRRWIFAATCFWVLASCAPKEEKSPRVPKFPSKGEWLQTEPWSEKSFLGKVTLVYFWDYTCLNCLRDLSYVRQWAERYQDRGFQVLLVHAPEFDFGSKRENVEQALRYYRIPFPVYLDNRFEFGKAFKIYSWPTKVLVNSEARIIRTEVGEGRVADFETSVRVQLHHALPHRELPEPVLDAEPYTYEEEVCGRMSNETYVGYKRASWLGGEIANQDWTKPGKTTVFEDRGDRVKHGFFLHGLWTNHEDAFRHARETESLTDYLGLTYRGHEVYAVLGQDDKERESPVYVTRDDAPVPEALRGRDLRVDGDGKTYVPLRESRLYQLITGEDDREHEIKLWTRGGGISVSTFSFANRCLAQIDLFSGS